MGPVGDPVPRPVGREVEFAVTACTAALRLGTVVQMAPALPTGLDLARPAAVYATAWVCAAVLAVVVSVAGLVRRRPLPPRWVVLDGVLVLAVCTVAAPTIPVDHLIGSWVGWPGAVTLSYVLSIGGLPTVRWWLACLLPTMAVYAAYALPAVRAGALTSVLGNLLSYLVLGGTVRLVVWFVRRIARQADDARAEVARLARREEVSRAQLAMHNAAAVMQMLAGPAVPAPVRRELETQAQVEVLRMRAYLRGDPAARSGYVRTVGAVAREACVGFADLGITATLDLVEDVPLDPAAADAVHDAVTTLLHNVRSHAGARSVVLHGDTEDDRWTLTVHDDGVGFDPGAVALGVGLREQAGAALVVHGVVRRVTSAPGRGTTVVLDGALP